VPGPAEHAVAGWVVVSTWSSWLGVGELECSINEVVIQGAMVGSGQVDVADSTNGLTEEAGRTSSRFGVIGIRPGSGGP